MTALIPCGCRVHFEGWTPEHTDRCVTHRLAPPPATRPVVVTPAGSLAERVAAGRQLAAAVSPCIALAIGVQGAIRRAVGA